MKKLLLILLCFPLLLFSQNEKRLALVIGNSDYQYLPKLLNPVGDALLIAETLDSLGFEIMLETNIKTKRKFLNKIIEFGERRDSFDVGFIFYAGHGMQVDGKNYLLPTKDTLKTEEDVRQYSVGVETVMKYLTQRTGEVNVLILDACRNNPLENNRGGGVGGLAEIQAKGSLIAFSTTAGNVAKDGDGDHSIYCTSLAKNMFIEGIDMDQVFRNVRREVMEITGQGTVNYDQLTGGSFYLVESTFEKEFALIDSLVEIGDNIYLSEAMGIVSSILKSQPKNQRALLEKGNIYIELEDYEKALKEFNKAIKLYPNGPKPFHYRGFMYLHNTKEYDKAISDYSKCIEIDSAYTTGYSNRADVYLELEDYEKALADYTNSVELDKDNPERYYDRADCYIAMEKYTDALKDLDKAIELAPEDWLLSRAKFYSNREQYDLALKDVNDAIQIDPNSTYAYNWLGHISLLIKDYDKALFSFNKTIEIDSANAYSYNRVADVYLELEDYEKALADYTSAIGLDKENPEGYDDRADCYIAMEDYISALVDLSKAIDLAPDEARWYAYRSRIYKYIKDKEKQLNDINTALDLDKEYPYGYRLRGDLYLKEKDYDNAIADYLQAINFDSLANYSKSHLASCYFELEKYSNALQVLNEAIAIDSTYTNFYYYRLQSYILLGDTLKAFEDAETLISMDSLSTTGYVMRGYLYRITNNNKKALDDLNHAVYLDTASSWSYNNRASYYMFIKEYELAELDYKKVTLISDTDPEPYFYLSRIYKLQEKYFKALKYLNKSIDKVIIGDGTISSEDLTDDIELVTLYLERGQLYELLEAPEEMCEDYQKACDLGDCEMFNKNCK